jgi:hypothetical protein
MDVPLAAATMRRLAVAERARSGPVRDHLRLALREAALDLVHPCPWGSTSEQGRRWLDAALAEPVEVAVGASMAILETELQRALRSAPDEILGCLERDSLLGAVGHE